MNKAYRQGQILKLIRARKVHTQDELARALSEIGVPATQVTLSRDIRELGLAKTADGYQQLGSEAPRPDLVTLASEFVQDIRIAQNMVVLKTAPGHANSVAVALDQEEWPEIVGTIAGDDTILIVLPDSDTAQRMRRRFMELLEVPS